MWLRHLISELKFKPSTAIILYEDNQVAIAMVRSSQHHGQSKHIDI